MMVGVNMLQSLGSCMPSRSLERASRVKNLNVPVGNESSEFGIAVAGQ